MRLFRHDAQVLRPRQLCPQFLFRLGAQLRRALRHQLLPEHAGGGIHLHGFKNDQGLAFPDLFPLPDQNGVHYAAFKVLHGLAFAFDLYLSGRNNRSGDLSEDGPQPQTAEEKKDNQHALPDDAPGVFHVIAVFLCGT